MSRPWYDFVDGCVNDGIVNLCGVNAIR